MIGKEESSLVNSLTYANRATSSTSADLKISFDHIITNALVIQVRFYFFTFLFFYFEVISNQFIASLLAYTEA